MGKASAIEIEDYLADALDGRRVEFETLLTKHHKGPRNVEIMLVPDLGVDGKVHGIHLMCIDITERKVVEQQTCPPHVCRTAGLPDGYRTRRLRTPDSW